MTNFANGRETLGETDKALKTDSEMTETIDIYMAKYMAALSKK